MREVTIAACFVERGSEVVLVRQLHRGSGREHWALPAGKVEPGETVLEGLARELREEAGLSLSGDPALLYVAQTVSVSRNISWTTYTFVARAVSGSLAPADPDGLILDAQYFSRAEAARLVGEFQPLAVMREPVMAYLGGEAVAGSLWVYNDAGLVSRIGSSG